MLLISTQIFAAAGTEILINEMTSGNYTMKFNGRNCSLVLVHSIVGGSYSKYPREIYAELKKNGEQPIVAIAEVASSVVSANKLVISQKKGMFGPKLEVIVNIDSYGRPVSAMAFEKSMSQSRSIDCNLNQDYYWPMKIKNPPIKNIKAMNR